MVDSNNKQAELFQSFKEALDHYDKNACVALVQSALESGKSDVVSLYTDILAPSLNDISSNDKNQEIAIWEEHLKSGIVRTLIEICYPYVLSAITPLPESVSNKKVVILCLKEEFHELGARMAADFMTMLGFDVYFIGANTPEKEVFSAVVQLKPRVMLISVSNYYHLPKLQDLIDDLRDLPGDAPLMAVGGYAVDHTRHAHDYLHPDFFVYSYEDLLAIREAVL